MLWNSTPANGMQEGGRGMDGGWSTRKGWMAGGSGMEEVRQGRKEEARQSGQEGREGERKRGRAEEGRGDPSNEAEEYCRGRKSSDLIAILY